MLLRYSNDGVLRHLPLRMGLLLPHDHRTSLMANSQRNHPDLRLTLRSRSDVSRPRLLWP